MEVLNAIGCALEQTFRSAPDEAESTVPFASRKDNGNVSENLYLEVIRKIIY